MGCLCQKCTILTIFLQRVHWLAKGRAGAYQFLLYCKSPLLVLSGESCVDHSFCKKPRFRYFSCQKATRLHSEPTPWNWRRELKHRAISVMLLFQIQFFAARMVKKIGGNYFSPSLTLVGVCFISGARPLCSKSGNIFVLKKAISLLYLCPPKTISNLPCNPHSHIGNEVQLSVKSTLFTFKAPLQKFEN